jgi:hypothetical protein
MKDIYIIGVRHDNTRIRGFDLGDESEFFNLDKKVPKKEGMLLVSGFILGRKHAIIEHLMKTTPDIARTYKKLIFCYGQTEVLEMDTGFIDESDPLWVEVVKGERHG